ncbi:OmpA family protein [Buchnera aphidicola]|uniref:Outer membrane protein A n=1 Tax=Buchnera aphidicola subsp. Acyrthosiphon pisum (strain 5A) TaxID=563178 RepID=A0A7U4DIC8_BUCA5|nr:OmpA family protein [Buchnera aphidicola]ADP66721.1 outer membrane protein A precursor [Buchnera aphidicola str. TLW03 (Acyrthosiphon pisum)]ADP67823.1 outer membrane protein A precursor [Buchnera aphidicola str. JF98 (Acyrthosiphon pisum)]OQX98262.1 MAG: OmpA-like protein [Erwiniaceae bacterium 4572_131]ACL30136.1 outer membrane protein A precursor [Buchnera aphidicola str. Tuc7 (Acyrthosiphon pisum)]ACL30690.1 outer membrane protein A precursor [Buchnera aphidicola str. 5A (Acyrthosiphon 
MKKRALAIAFLLASLIPSAAQAEEENGWYLGAKFGWSHFNPLKYDMNNSQVNNNDSSIENLSAPIVGLFLGYEFNPYFSLEIENDTNGFFPHLIFQKNNEHIQSNSVQLATKLSYPITDEFHLYTKLGGIVSWNDLSSKNTLKNLFSKESALLPSLSLGAEYIFNETFITRLDYTWKNSVKNIANASIKPALGDAVLSIGWKFGKSNISDIFSSDDSEPLNEQYSVLNENINFPFNSTELKPSSYDKLNKLDDDIKDMQLKNVSIVLLGHADKIGSDEYNQKLSEDRAYSIKNYLASRGFSRDKITVKGMGKLYPLTNQVCRDVVNKPLLISCLAPDRRVEIEVLSDVQ